MTVTTGGRATRSSSSPSSSPNSRSNDSSSSRSSSSGLTIWTSKPSSAPSSCSVSSLTDWVAVTISPRWNRTWTSDAGLASIFSAKSVSDAPRGSRTTVAVAAGDRHAADRRRLHVVELLTPLLLGLAAARPADHRDARTHPPCRHGADRAASDRRRSRRPGTTAAGAGPPPEPPPPPPATGTDRRHREHRAGRGRRRGAPVRPPGPPGPPAAGRRRAGRPRERAGPASCRGSGAGHRAHRCHRDGTRDAGGTGPRHAGRAAGRVGVVARTRRRQRPAHAGRAARGERVVARTGTGRARSRRACRCRRRLRPPLRPGAAPERAPGLGAGAGVGSRGDRAQAASATGAGDRGGCRCGASERAPRGPVRPSSRQPSWRAQLAAPSAGAAGAAGAAAGKASRSLRTTGGSTVEEADRTNSPSSLQLGHDGLALDTELFGELVDPDLGHISPVSVRGRSARRGPSLLHGGTHRCVLIECSSACSTSLPDGRSCC